MSSTRKSVPRVSGARVPRSPRWGFRCVAFGAALTVSSVLSSAASRVAHADDAPSAVDQAGRVDDSKENREKAPPYRVDDVTQVFVGNPRLFKKPCMVSTDRVYRSIPEYQEILEKNLTDKDVRYHFLMRKASDKFSRAVQALARDQGYDLVAGKGAVSPTSTDSPAIPDGTDGTISRLPS